VKTSKLKQSSKLLKKWTFNPVDKIAWSRAQVRVMLLGAEPNDDAKYTGPRDMGEWFSKATPVDSYSKNRRFYTNNVAQLCGALDLQHFTQPNSLNAREIDRLFRAGSVTQILKSLRYADLKATGGGASAETDLVEEYVLNNLEEVLNFWDPSGSFLPPTHTVVQGGHAHRVFMKHIRPKLAEKDWDGLYLGMHHPSHQGSYESTRKGLSGMHQEFLTFFSPSAHRWDGEQWTAMI
jgi:hypothetical protein